MWRTAQWRGDANDKRQNPAIPNGSPREDHVSTGRKCHRDVHDGCPIMAVHILGKAPLSLRVVVVALNALCRAGGNEFRKNQVRSFPQRYKTFQHEIRLTARMHIGATNAQRNRSVEGDVNRSRHEPLTTGVTWLPE